MVFGICDTMIRYDLVLKDLVLVACVHNINHSSCCAKNSMALVIGSSGVGGVESMKREAQPQILDMLQT